MLTFCEDLFELFQIIFSEINCQYIHTTNFRKNIPFSNPGDKLVPNKKQL